MLGKAQSGRVRAEMAADIVRLICVRWVIVRLGGIARTSLELHTNWETVYSVLYTPHHRLLLPVRSTEAHNDRCCGRFNRNVH
jgi:hypothetical protein